MLASMTKQPSTTCARNVIHRRSHGSARHAVPALSSRFANNAHSSALDSGQSSSRSISRSQATPSRRNAGMIVAHNASTALCRQNARHRGNRADKSAHHAYTASASRHAKAVRASARRVSITSSTAIALSSSRRSIRRCRRWACNCCSSCARRSRYSNALSASAKLRNSATSPIAHSTANAASSNA